MTRVIYLVAHGASDKHGPKVNLGGFEFASVALPGTVMHFATFNIVSKLMLEAANCDNPAQSLKARLQWLIVDIPTTEYKEPGSVIPEHSFTEALSMIRSGFHLMPDFEGNTFGGTERLKSLYGEYLHSRIRVGDDCSLEFYINKKSLDATVKLWLEMTQDASTGNPGMTNQVLYML